MVRVGNSNNDRDKYLQLLKSRFGQSVHKSSATDKTRPALLGITNPQNRVSSGAAATNQSTRTNTTNQTTSTQNLNSLGSSLTQLNSALKSFEVPQQKSADTEISSTSTTDTALTGTESASELKKIIETDEGQLQSLQGQSTEIDNQEAAAKDDLGIKDKAVTEASTNHNKTQQDLNLAKEGESSAKNKKLSAKTALDTAETKLTNATNTYNERKQQTQTASSAYETAKSNTSSAKQALTNATSTLNSTPQTLPNGAENPAYTAALEAKNEAEINLKKAEEAEQKAQDDYNLAKQNEEKALKEKEAAQTDRDAKQAEYKKAETQYEQAQKKLTEATKTEQEAAKKLEQANSDKTQAQDTLDKATIAKDNHQDNIQNLQSKIDENKSLLKTLEAKESSKKQKGISNGEKQKTDTPDLTNHVAPNKATEQKEQNLTRVGAKDAGQASRVTNEGDYSNPVMLAALARKEPKVGNDGREYREIDFNGKKYYSRNGVLISAEQYRRATQS